MREDVMVQRDVRDEVVYLRAAGLDLGKRFLLGVRAGSG
jgi:hypothetical protein